MTAGGDPALAVAQLLDSRVVHTRPLGGTAFRCELADGRRVVAKSGGGLPDATTAEAAGLRWLRVPGGPSVPHVLAVDADWLVSEFVSGTEIVAGRTSSAPDRFPAARLGRGLAALHAAGAPAFGAAPPDGPVDAWIGRAPMRNQPGGSGHRGDWPSWYAEHRVLPYLRTARDAGTLTAAEAGPIEAVCTALPRLAGPPEPPARLHGDLWSGNILVRGDAGWLIDPAAHGGHRETDLAMLALFGFPHLDEVRAGYEESAPLAPGWRQRIGLHQLFPLLVHAVLFGRGYAGQAVAAARSALAQR